METVNLGVRNSSRRHLHVTLAIVAMTTLCVRASGCGGLQFTASSGCYVYVTKEDGWKSDCEAERLRRFNVERLPRRMRALVVSGNNVPVLRQDTFYANDLTDLLNLTLANNNIQV